MKCFIFLLQRRQIPEGDPRLKMVTDIMNRRLPLRVGAAQQMQLEA